MALGVPVISTATMALTTGDCDVTAYTATSAQSQTLTAGQVYRVIATTDCWIKVGTNPTAVAATDGNVFLPASRELYIQAHTSALKVAAVRAAADGSLSLALVQ